MTVKNIKLFGLGVTSLGAFADTYRAYVKRARKKSSKRSKMPALAYVGDTRQLPAQTAEIYLIDTVTNLIAVRESLPDGCAVVVSDSPILLTELPGMVALDWDHEKSFVFQLRAPDLRTFERVRKGKKTAPNVVVIPDSITRLGLVLEQTTQGGILTPFNMVMRQLPHTDREIIRQLLKPYAENKITMEALTETLNAALAPHMTALLRSHADELLAALQLHGAVLQAAIQKAVAMKSFVSTIKGHNVTAFEVRFFTRLVKE